MGSAGLWFVQCHHVNVVRIGGRPVLIDLLWPTDQAVMNALLTLPSFIATFPQINTSTKALAAKNSTLCVIPQKKHSAGHECDKS